MIKVQSGLSKLKDIPIIKVRPGISKLKDMPIIKVWPGLSNLKIYANNKGPAGPLKFEKTSL